MASLSSAFLQRGVVSASQCLAEAPLQQPRLGSGGNALTFAAPPRPLQVVAMKKIQGTVVKTVNDKTASVEVKRIYAHPLYKKRITSVKKYQVHDPDNKCKVGDIVTLEKCAPMSKTKKFIVVDIQPPRIAGAGRAELDLPLESAQ